MDRRIIIENSKNIYEIIKERQRILFRELKSATTLKGTELCMSLIWLMRTKQIVQLKEEGIIIYALP